jgi:hypothetical protein
VTGTPHPRLAEIGRVSANTTLGPDITEVNRARHAAARARARFLVEVLEGRLRAVDAPWEACGTGDRRLMRVRLAQLLATTPHWDAGRTNAAVGHLAHVLGLNATQVRGADLGWLADSRSAGRRVLAWLDVFRPRTTPWPGFPYSPVPDRFADEGPGAPPALAARDRDGVPRGT